MEKSESRALRSGNLRAFGSPLSEFGRRWVTLLGIDLEEILKHLRQERASWLFRDQLFQICFGFLVILPPYEDLHQAELSNCDRSERLVFGSCKYFIKCRGSLLKVFLLKCDFTAQTDTFDLLPGRISFGPQEGLLSLCRF